MIANDREYRLTLYWARRFRRHAEKLRQMIEVVGIDPAIRQSQIDATESEASILEAEIAEYEAHVDRGPT